MMDDDLRKLRNDSTGTNYTFRDKNGNLVTSNDAYLGMDDSVKKDMVTDSSQPVATTDEGVPSSSY